MAGKIGAIILAAGFSNRFGSIKLCAELDNGATVFSQTLARIRTAVPNYKVITRPELADLLSPFETELNIFQDAEKGMGATLAHAISLIESWDGCLVCLADMPFIAVETYKSLASQLGDNNIVIPVHNQQPGNPVGFGKKYFPELLQLSGDSGGRPVVQAHQADVLRLETEDAAILYDIDTPDDLEKYQLLSD